MNFKLRLILKSMVLAFIFLTPSLGEALWLNQESEGPTVDQDTQEFFQPVSGNRKRRPKILQGPARIIDGDTLAIGSTRVRLEGLAAPELNEPGGYNSRLRLIRITQNKRVDCRLTGAKSYRREIGVCYVDGKDVAVEMVNSGNARDCPRFSEGRYAKYETFLSRNFSLPRYCNQ